MIYLNTNFQARTMMIVTIIIEEVVWEQTGRQTDELLTFIILV